VEDRKADADAHLAAARSQNTETGISGDLTEDKENTAAQEIASAVFFVFRCFSLSSCHIFAYNHRYFIGYKR